MLRRSLLLAALAAALSGCATTAPLEAPTVAKDQRPGEYQPKRLAPTAMEAWIAPWEDATGDLYPPSTVYIEVSPERWQYGAEDGRLTVLRPLQVQRRVPVELQTPSAASASAAIAADLPAPFAAPQAQGAMRGT